MSATHAVFHGGGGYGWHVRDLRRGTLSGSVAGPYTSRESAQAKADELSAAAAEQTGTPDEVAAAAGIAALEAISVRGDLVSFADTQAQLNTAVARALEAFALMHDRYDAELGEIREQLDSLRAHVLDVARAIDRIDRLGSVKA